MDATKQLDIQRQIRHNNEDYQQYARELILWESEMKRKDRELAEKDVKKDIPPIRKKSKKEESQNENKPNKPISAFDYSSWDRFDVDKACEELDKEDSDEDEDSEVEEEDLDRIATAVYNKEQGNKLVKEGKWGEAIEKYNVAIQTYPHDSVFYANRALCFLKMKNYVSAEADCTASLKLDNSYVKAYQRRAAARRSLNQFQEARKDLLKVLTLEPNNKQAETELEELSRKLNIPYTTKNTAKSAELISPTDSKTFKEKSNISTKLSSTPQLLSTSNGSVTKSVPPDLSWVPPYDTSVYSLVPPQHIPPNQRSKKPLIKINVEPEPTVPVKPTATTSTSTSVAENKASKIQIIGCIGSVYTISDQEEETKILDPVNDSEQRRKKLDMLESAWNELQNSNPYKKEKDEEKSVKKDNVKVETKVKQVCREKRSIPSTPKTCSQFELHWRTLKSSEEDLYLYLKQIDGREFPNIFQEGLDTFTFIEILQCLCGKFLELKNNIGDYMRGLAYTPRLGCLLMLMTRDEKSHISKLLKYCEEEKQVSATELEKLKQKFEL